MKKRFRAVRFHSYATYKRIAEFSTLIATWWIWGIFWGLVEDFSL